MSQILLLLALLFAPWCAANAGLVLDNLFPDPTSGMSVVQRQLSSSAWYATPITTDGSDYTLTEVSAEIADSNPAGTLFMEVWTVGGPLDNYAPQTKIDRLFLVDANYPKVFTGSVSLSANTSYFIVTGVDNGGGQWFEQINYGDPFGPYFSVQSGSWSLSTIGVGSPQSLKSADFGASWTDGGALSAPLRMSITAMAVPEPSTWRLLGLGVLVLAGHALRRRV